MEVDTCGTAAALTKAETWAVGRCLYALLSTAQDAVFGRVPVLKDHHYAAEDLPALPETCPDWLAYVLKGLVRSDEGLRLSAPDAMQVPPPPPHPLRGTGGRGQRRRRGCAPSHGHRRGRGAGQVGVSPAFGPHPPPPRRPRGGGGAVGF